MRLIALAAVAASTAACTTAQQDTARDVIPPLQELLAGYTGLSPQTQCNVLNQVREWYPAGLQDVADRLGTPDVLCVTPSGELVTAPVTAADIAASPVPLEAQIDQATEW